jgi:hypothetical protein
MQESDSRPCLKFSPSARFALIQSALAPSGAAEMLADPSNVSKLFGSNVAAVFQSERICSMQQMAVVLRWIVQQAECCAQHLQSHPLKLLPSLRAAESDSSTAHVALSTSLCCQLLCGMFLDCFDEGSRPHQGKWPFASFSGMLNSFSESCQSTLCCVLQYFVAVHTSLSSSEEPLVTDTSFIVLQRNAVRSSSNLRRADTWSKLPVPLCRAIVSRGSLEPKVDDGHVVVDFANKMIGGGVLSGGNVQEEIMFSKRPEAMVSCLLCETMYKTECIVIYGVRCFSDTEGYGGSFAFSRAAPRPAHSATITILGHPVAATAGYPRCARVLARLSFNMEH